MNTLWQVQLGSKCFALFLGRQGALLAMLLTPAARNAQQTEVPASRKIRWRWYVSQSTQLGHQQRAPTGVQVWEVSLVFCQDQYDAHSQLMLYHQATKLLVCMLALSRCASPSADIAHYIAISDRVKS